MSLRAISDPNETNQITIYADSLADLSPEQLQAYEQSYKVKGIYVSNYKKEPSFSYSPNLYRKVYGKMQEILTGIDDSFSPEKKFVYIYRRISKRISYDYPAAYPRKGDYFQEKYAKDNSDKCRNLVNGLLKGKCVCAGFSNILKNACLLKGIPAIEITGKVYNRSNGLFYKPELGVKPFEYHAWNQVQLSNGWIQVDDTWESNGTTKYAGKNNRSFFDSHSFISFDSFLRDASHRIVDFDLENFINQELGFEQGTYHYTETEINKYLDEMERLDMAGLDMSSLRDTIVRDQQRNDLFERTFGYSEEALRYYGCPEKTIAKYKACLSKNSVTSKLLETIHTTMEKKKGNQVERLKFLGFTDKQIDLLMQMKFDPNTGKRVVNVLDNAEEMFFTDMSTYGFSDFEIKKLLDAKFDGNTGKPLTNVREYALTNLRSSNNGCNLPNTTLAEIQRDFTGFHPVIVTIITSMANSGYVTMQTLKNLSNFLDRKDTYNPEQIEQIAKSFEESVDKAKEILKQEPLPLTKQEAPKSIPPINIILGDEPMPYMEEPEPKLESESETIDLSDLAENFEMVPASARFEVLSQMSKTFERESSSITQESLDVSSKDDIQNDEDMEL